MGETMEGVLADPSLDAEKGIESPHIGQFPMWLGQYVPDLISNFENIITGFGLRVSRRCPHENISLPLKNHPRSLNEVGNSYFLGFARMYWMGHGMSTDSAWAA